MHLSSASHLMILLSSLVLLMSAFTSGLITLDPKPTTCCKKTEKLIKDIPRYKFTQCLRLPETEKCFKCVIFIDVQGNMYNIDPNAPQLNGRIARLEKRGVKCEDYTNSTNTNTGTVHP